MGTPELWQTVELFKVPHLETKKMKLERDT